MNPDAAAGRLTIAGLQSLIAEMYSQKDEARGVDGTFMWLMEEVGELASALRHGTPEELAAEFADVLAWLVDDCQRGPRRLRAGRDGQIRPRLPRLRPDGLPLRRGGKAVSESAAKAGRIPQKFKRQY